MWNDDIDLPSVEDRDDDIENEIPDLDLDWNEWWERNTIHKQLYDFSQEVKELWWEARHTA